MLVELKAPLEGAKVMKQEPKHSSFAADWNPRPLGRGGCQGITYERKDK